MSDVELPPFDVHIAIDACMDGIRTIETQIKDGSEPTELLARRDHLMIRLNRLTTYRDYQVWL